MVKQRVVSALLVYGLSFFSPEFYFINRFYFRTYAFCTLYFSMCSLKCFCVLKKIRIFAPVIMNSIVFDRKKVK